MIPKLKTLNIMCYIFIFFSCDLFAKSNALTSVQKIEPLYTNSIVSTDIDFITSEDLNTFTNIQYLGQETKEMPDQRNDVLIDNATYTFRAFFNTSDTVDIWVHSSFLSQDEAQKYAQMVVDPLGKLPQVMRKDLDHVVIHKGDETAFGESEGHFFVLYSENMITRINNHDLEETVFHESVHATLESIYKDDPKWISAQKNDNCYITKYGALKPALEDLPETAIFAYTMIIHAGRLSTDIEEWITTNNSNKLLFFKEIFN